MRILVTAGPTREFFDSVRFISNPSSGRMGYAIAVEAAKRGHEVVLISGPVALPPPSDVRVIRVVSAEDMLQACLGEFDECHVVVMTAAVCDYRPAEQIQKKLKKQNRARTIQLLPTEDILARMGAMKGSRVVIGFAMEDHDAHKHAEAKLKRKQCDAIVLNGISNVGSDDAEVQILRKDGGWESPRAGTKREIASIVADLMESLGNSQI
jgi:phosphopantothenoylcysteine decarboxylase/phosphopantothenate--cysteine ligase